MTNLSTNPHLQVVLQKLTFHRVNVIKSTATCIFANENFYQIEFGFHMLGVQANISEKKML